MPKKLMKLRRSTLAAIMFVAGLPATLVFAAQDNPPLGVVEQSAAAEMHSNPRTIQMLLQMQGADRSLESGDRLRRGDVPDASALARNRALKDATLPPSGQTALGGKYERQAKPLPTPNVGWRDDSATRGAATITTPTPAVIKPEQQAVGARGDSRAPASAQAASQEDASEEILFPLRLLRLIRENRGWVLTGCLLVLLVAAGGVMTSSRRR